MPYPKKGECRNTGKTRFKKGHKGYWQGRKRPTMTGRKHPQWKGIIQDKNGYIFILMPNHPFCTNKGYIRRSRLVMEKKLGRYLTPEEVVHHINGIKDDDRIKNLQLFANKSNHTKFHWFLKKHISRKAPQFHTLFEYDRFPRR